MDLRNSVARSLQCCLEAGPGAQSPGRGEGPGGKVGNQRPPGISTRKFQ